jgi:hypothetical protein
MKLNNECVRDEAGIADASVIRKQYQSMDRIFGKIAWKLNFESALPV